MSRIDAVPSNGCTDPARNPGVETVGYGFTVQSQARVSSPPPSILERMPPEILSQVLDKDLTASDLLLRLGAVSRNTRAITLDDPTVQNMLKHKKPVIEAWTRLVPLDVRRFLSQNGAEYKEVILSSTGRFGLFKNSAQKYRALSKADSFKIRLNCCIHNLTKSMLFQDIVGDCERDAQTIASGFKYLNSIERYFILEYSTPIFPNWYRSSPDSLPFENNISIQLLNFCFGLSAHVNHILPDQCDKLFALMATKPSNVVSIPLTSWRQKMLPFVNDLASRFSDKLAPDNHFLPPASQASLATILAELGGEWRLQPADARRSLLAVLHSLSPWDQNVAKAGLRRSTEALPAEILEELE